MGDSSETNTKVLYRELFLGVVALKTPLPQNHYLRDKVPFLKSVTDIVDLLDEEQDSTSKFVVPKPKH